MKKEIKKVIFWVLLYSVGMAFIESSVVIYLRALFYPEGFSFPLVDIGNHLALTELLREFATLIMLISIGFLAGKTKPQRFAFFIFSFAVWDIFYYVFLKMLLNWPSSLLEWDLLFLIPVAWVGPVIAPVICAFLMIILSIGIIYKEQKHETAKIKLTEWLLLIAGSLTVIFSFIMDYLAFLNQYYSVGEILSFRWLPHAGKLTESYIPQSFNWYVFLAGIALISTGIFIYLFRKREVFKTHPQH